MRRYTLTVNDQPKVIDVEAVGANLFRVKVDGRLINVTLDDHRDMAHLAPITPSIPASGPARMQAGAAPVASASVAPRREAPAEPEKGGVTLDKLTAPMPGVILSVITSVGAQVKRGDPLVVLEAMKMKNELKAPRDGQVAEIYVKDGQQVKYGEFLVRFKG